MFRREFKNWIYKMQVGTMLNLFDQRPADSRAAKWRWNAAPKLKLVDKESSALWPRQKCWWSSCRGRLGEGYYYYDCYYYYYKEFNLRIISLLVKNTLQNWPVVKEVSAEIETGIYYCMSSQQDVAIACLSVCPSHETTELIFTQWMLRW